MKTPYLLSMLLLGLILLPAQAEVSDSKKQEIHQFFHLTGIDRSMDDLKLQILNGLRAEKPDMTSSFWDKFMQEVDTRDLEEKLILVYDKYYSIDDLKVINAFYESQAGQKMNTFSPQIGQESAKIARDWGQNIRRMADEETQSTQKK